jgi:hypothetical protein
MEALEKNLTDREEQNINSTRMKKRFRFISFFFANDIYKLSERFILDFF